MTETLDITRVVAEILLWFVFFVATNKKNTLNLPQFHTFGVGNVLPDLFLWEPEYEYEIFSIQIFFSILF